jgi:predicted deacylase
MSLSAVWTEVDLEAPGRQVGFIRVEHSVHRSAYGTIPVPLAVFANGSGPTILLMAGSHGDEYEGQLALTRLIRTLDVSRIHGRILVLPAANQPAVMAGRRTSPLDSGNLNRCFGDRFADTPTGQIAAFITEE